MMIKFSTVNKKKIINDPVYGFISVPSPLIFDLIEHPVIQRLRRIKQLGLTNYVYPGANHSRFQHAVGATYLMDQAIQVIRQKNLEINNDEADAAMAAILLHDIGHGPFSHALESGIIENIAHEQISELLMERLNLEFKGKLDLAIQIFQNKYSKKFLHQLVSSQLDMDRLDYLKRDSFFTGVTEGVIGSDRIIKMLNVVNDNLVVEAKGIYSIEKFLIARRLMYWQVYLHKTVIAAENIMVKLLQRAKYLANNGQELFATEPLRYFLYHKISDKFLNDNKDEILSNFIMLDDNDIFIAAKAWESHPDRVLAYLSKSLINRSLPRIKLQKKPFPKEMLVNIKERAIQLHKWKTEEVEYLVFSKSITNNAYSQFDEKIQILYNTGELIDIVQASDMLNVSVLYKIVKKYFLCYPKDCGI